MTSFTYKELQRVFDLTKTNKNTKVTPWSHAQAIICQMEVPDKFFDLVMVSTKRFKLKRDKLNGARPRVVPTERELEEIYLVIPKEGDSRDNSDHHEDNEEDPVENAGDDSHDKIYRVSLLELERRQKYRRTAPIISYLTEEAARNKVTVHELIGVILKQMDYHGDKRRSSSSIADTLLQGGTVQLLPMLPTCYLQQNLQLGRTGYNVLKNIVKEKVQLEMPTWKRVRQYQNTITPPVKTDTHLPGVRFGYEDALSSALSRILDTHGSESLAYNLTCDLKDGVDGSGSHAIYHQANNEKTNNIIMYMFCVLRVVEDISGEVVFEEKLVASPFAMRPIFLVLGKEVLGNLADVKRTVSERQELAETDFLVNTRFGPRSVKLKASLSMIDGKMRGLVTGLGGAYCLLCKVEKDIACGRSGNNIPVDLEQVCFNINRTTEEARTDYERLVKPDGTVARTSYQDRKGLTQEPIVEETSIFSVSPLHSLMRCFDFVKLLIYHLRSETFIWSESALKLGESYGEYQKAKKDIKAALAVPEINIPLDACDPTGMGGNANKGDLCKRLMTDYRDLMVSFVPERFQDDLREVMCRLWVVIKVYTSKDEVNVRIYKQFCLDLYNLVLNSFENEKRWISISPTLHGLLAHSWELISNYDGRGLGDFTEGGLEHNNKFLRFYRRNLARKIDQVSNMEDCLMRLWLRSDPLIRDSGPAQPICKHCKRVGHFTISCPEKSAVPASVVSLVDHYLSQLIK